MTYQPNTAAILFDHRIQSMIVTGGLGDLGYNVDNLWQRLDGTGALGCWVDYLSRTQPTLAVIHRETADLVSLSPNEWYNKLATLARSYRGTLIIATHAHPERISPTERTAIKDNPRADLLFFPSVPRESIRTTLEGIANGRRTILNL